MRLLLETFKFLLKLDFRDKEVGKVSYRRIILIFVTNFIWFLVLSFSIMMSNLEKEIESFLFDFAFIFFSLELLLIAFTMIVESDQFLLNRLEIEFFSFIPIDSLTYSTAKYLSFLLFVFLLGLSYNLSPMLALLLMWIFKPETSGIFLMKISLSYFSLSLLYVTVISNFMLFILLLVGKSLKIETLKRLFLPIKIFAIFAVFFAYQIINKYLSAQRNSILSLIDENFSYLKFLPQYTFSKIFVSTSGVLGEDLKVTEISLSIIVILLLFILPIFVLKVETLKDLIFEYHIKASKGKKYLFIELLKKVRKLFFKSGSDFAIYEIVYIHLRRDKSIKAKILSMFVISIAVAFYLLLFDNVEDPLLVPISKANSMMLVSLLFTVTAGISSLQHHRDHEASWIYNFTEKKYEVLSFGFKVLWHHILLPLLVIFYVVYYIKTLAIFSTTLHIFTTFLILVVFFKLAIIYSPFPPLSRPLEKMLSFEKILMQIFSLVSLFVILLIEKWIYGSIVSFGNYVPFLLLFCFVIFFEGYSRKALKQKAKRIFDAR